MRGDAHTIPRMLITAEHRWITASTRSCSIRHCRMVFSTHPRETDRREA